MSTYLVRPARVWVALTDNEVQGWIVIVATPTEETYLAAFRDERHARAWADFCVSMDRKQEAWR